MAKINKDKKNRNSSIEETSSSSVEPPVSGAVQKKIKKKSGGSSEPIAGTNTTPRNVQVVKKSDSPYVDSASRNNKEPYFEQTENEPPEEGQINISSDQVDSESELNDDFYDSEQTNTSDDESLRQKGSFRKFDKERHYNRRKSLVKTYESLKEKGEDKRIDPFLAQQTIHHTLTSLV